MFQLGEGSSRLVYTIDKIHIEEGWKCKWFSVLVQLPHYVHLGVDKPSSKIETVDSESRVIGLDRSKLIHRWRCDATHVCGKPTFVYIVMHCLK